MNLSPLVHIGEAVEKEQGFKEMAHNRQEWVRQDRKGFPGTVWRFAKVTLNLYRLRLFRVIPLVLAITNGEGSCTMWTADKRFFLAGCVVFR